MEFATTPKVALTVYARKDSSETASSAMVSLLFNLIFFILFLTIDIQSCRCLKIMKFLFSDVNECNSSPCNEAFPICVNTPGSYECVCVDGIARDHVSCKGRN